MVGQLGKHYSLRGIESWWWWGGVRDSLWLSIKSLRKRVKSHNARYTNRATQKQRRSKTDVIISPPPPISYKSSFVVGGPSTGKKKTHSRKVDEELQKASSIGRHQDDSHGLCFPLSGLLFCRTQTLQPRFPFYNPARCSSSYSRNGGPATTTTSAN